MQQMVQGSTGCMGEEEETQYQMRSTKGVESLKLSKLLVYQESYRYSSSKSLGGNR